MPTLLWLGAVTLGTLGTALVFLGVTIAAAFVPGVVLIDLALVLAAAAGWLELRQPAHD